MAIIGKVSEASKQKEAQHKAIKEAERQSRARPQPAKTSNSSEKTSSGKTITRSGGKTYVTNSRGKVIELASGQTMATPEAATVLKDIKHKDVKTVKVDYGKYKTRTEVTEEQYKSYQNDPKNFYKNNRMPEPTQQTIRTERQAPVGTKGIAQWSPGTQQNIRNAQAEIKRTRPYTENIGQARMNVPPKETPQGQAIPWKTRDSVTGVLTPTIAYQTTTQTKPQYSQYTPEPKRDWLSKQIYKVDKNIQSKLPQSLQDDIKYNSPKETRKRFEAQPEPQTFSGKVKRQAQGVLLKVKEELEYKPLKTGVNVGVGVAVGAIAGIGAAGGLVARSVTKGTLIGGGALYTGLKTREYLQPSTQLKKGEILGGTIKEVAEFGVGAKIGGSIIPNKLPVKVPSEIKIKTDSYYGKKNIKSTPTLEGSKTKTGGIKEYEILKRDTNLVSELNKVVVKKPVVSVARGVKGDTTFSQVTVKGKTYTTISRSGNIIKSPKTSVTKMVGENLVTKTTRFTKNKIKSSTTISKPLTTKTIAETNISKGENINVLKGSKGELTERSISKNVRVQERNLSMFKKQVIRTTETTKAGSKTNLRSSMTDYSKGQYLRLSNEVGERRFQNIFYSKSKEAKLEFGKQEPPKDINQFDIRVSKSPEGRVNIENIMFEKQRGARLLSETKYNRETFGETIITTEPQFKPFENVNLKGFKIKGKKGEFNLVSEKSKLLEVEKLKIGEEPKFKSSKSKIKSETKLFEGVKSRNKILTLPILSTKTDPIIKTNINTQTNILKQSLTPKYNVINSQITQPKSIFDVRTRITQKVDLKQDYITKLNTTKITSYNPFVNNYTFKPYIPTPTPPPPFIGGGFFKGIGKGFGSTTPLIKKISKQKKKYTPGAYEAAFGITGEKTGQLTGLNIRPIATN